MRSGIGSWRRHENSGRFVGSGLRDGPIHVQPGPLRRRWRRNTTLRREITRAQRVQSACALYPFPIRGAVR
jgi:hypothetical protein